MTPRRGDPAAGDWIVRATIVAPDTSRCLAYIAYGPMDRTLATNRGVYLTRADLARPAGAVAGFSRATHQVLGVDPRHLTELEGL